MTKDQILKSLSHRLTRLRSRLLDGADAFAGKVSALPPAVEVGSETGIGIVGCGFVADFYAANLTLHPELRLVGSTDLDGSRAEQFAARNGGKVYATVDDLLADPFPLRSW